MAPRRSTRSTVSSLLRDRHLRATTWLAPSLRKLRLLHQAIAPHVLTRLNPHPQSSIPQSAFRNPHIHWQITPRNPETANRNRNRHCKLAQRPLDDYHRPGRKILPSGTRVRYRARRRRAACSLYDHFPSPRKQARRVADFDNLHHGDHTSGFDRRQLVPAPPMGQEVPLHAHALRGHAHHRRRHVDAG